MPTAVVVVLTTRARYMRPADATFGTQMMAILTKTQSVIAAE